jgi:hypothetical protein
MLSHGTVEQRVLVKHHADLPAQPGRIKKVDIDPVDENATALGRIEAFAAALSELICQ